MTAPSEWVQFFEDANIPKEDATKYGVSFAENRISMNMLGDLNKEYLKDMGITVTGDIILILKHAKAVGGRLATDKALEVAPRKENPSTSSSNLQLKKTVNIISAPTKSTGNPVVITKPTLSKTTSLVTVKRNIVSAATVKTISKSNSSSSIPRVESGVSQRLGPPQAKPFTTAKPQAVLGESEERGRIFERLGASPEPLADDRPKKSAFSRLGGEEGDASDGDIPLASQTKTTSFGAPLKRKSEPAVVFNERSSLADDSSDEDVTPRLSTSAKSSKKRFVLIRTLPDGTKTKSIISPDDPILKKVPIKKQVVPAAATSTKTATTTSNSASFRFDNFRVEKPVDGFKNFPISLSTSTQSKFRSDKVEGGQVSVSARDRVNLRQSQPEPSRRSAAGSLGGTGHGNIKSRLSLKSVGEGERGRVAHLPPRRISPPRFDDKPSIGKVRTTVVATSNVKSRLTLNNRPSEDRKMERTPQRKPITAPDSHSSYQANRTKGNVYDRLG